MSAKDDLVTNGVMSLKSPNPDIETGDCEEESSLSDVAPVTNNQQQEDVSAAVPSPPDSPTFVRNHKLLTIDAADSPTFIRTDVVITNQQIEDLPPPPPPALPIPDDEDSPTLIRTAEIKNHNIDKIAENGEAKGASRGVSFASNPQVLSGRSLFHHRRGSSNVTQHHHRGSSNVVLHDIYGADIEEGKVGYTSNTQRTSNVMDIATGKSGGAHAVQCERINEDNERHALSAGARRLKTIKKILHLPKSLEEQEEELMQENELDSSRHSIHGRLVVTEFLEGEVAGEKHGPPGEAKRENAFQNNEQRQPSQTSVNNQNRHYRLQAVKPVPRGNKILRLLGISHGKVSIYETEPGESCSCFGLSPNQLIINFLHWTFRRSFTTFLLTAVVGFFSLTILFALFIWGLGSRHPECIGGVDFESDYFTDAFILSWTTFSTVGYGLIYAGISTGTIHSESDEVVDVRNCTGITIIVTLEAFVGVLFGSMCGAILFIKIARIQSFAQVTFSDIIVIRYGSGVEVDHQDQQSDDGSEDDEPGKIQCPAIEFRIVNRMNAIMGGEIIDSTVNIVASVDASQATTGVNRTLRRRRGKKGKKGGPRGGARRRQNKAGDDGPVSDEDQLEIDEANAKSLKKLRSSSVDEQTSTKGSIQEDNDGYIIAKRIFAKVEVESPDHPFFKRVWLLRHTLDENSPLLKSHAKNMIKRNKGFWPSELNNPEGVRAAVNFDSLLVSLSGTSNADANSVYAQHVYEFCDVVVGYRFCNMLYRDEDDDCLGVDTNLLNDVMEQAGGGGEPLDMRNREAMGDLLIL